MDVSCLLGPDRVITVHRLRLIYTKRKDALAPSAQCDTLRIARNHDASSPSARPAASVRLIEVLREFFLMSPFSA